MKVVPCQVCGEPMRLSNSRYRELVAAGAKPVCRRNGCERLCGRDIRDIARNSQVETITDVGRTGYVLAYNGMNGKDIPLAKRKLRRAIEPDFAMAVAPAEESQE